MVTTKDDLAAILARVSRRREGVSPALLLGVLASLGQASGRLLPGG